jgi:AraC family transcriptional regulator of adaptative response/methylated-DNA-[protein]-cysteine methyltransferase
MISTTAFTTDETRWNAVARRDRQADGWFWYGVRTTGVYCRPTCGSRRPNRANVTFFDTCDQAERDGYRACKKCQPAASDPDRIPDAVVRACTLINAAAEPPSLAQLAAAVNLSACYFQRIFKKAVGVTPKAYAAAQRLERFRAGLRDDPTVTQALYGAGFGSSSRCYETAGAGLGMTPGEYKSGGAGVLIRYAMVECSLGWLAVAATVRGVCLITFRDTPDSLRAELSARFPTATLQAGDAEFYQWVERVVTQVEAPGHALNLPLDIQGTAFQRKVWEALRAIPAGTTASYAEIAQRIGQSSAARAVAGACATNRLAVVIPCHRVVRTDGSLSGYRWGIARKRALLDREAGLGDQVKAQQAGFAQRYPQ